MKKTEREAQQIVKKLRIDDIPVNVERIAEHFGALLSFQPFDGDISGMLFREGDRVVIGINSAHPKTRQRFTIAHEVGHLLLHDGRPVILDRLVRVNLRDSKSGLATDAEEIEANSFAAEILMPRHLVMRELERRLPKMSSRATDWIIGELASAFEVSNQAMEYRLANLGIRTPT